MKLQPIEKAPKDGSEIVLYDGGYWVGYWSPTRYRFAVPVGWDQSNPTHWCPLPTLEGETEAGPIHLSQAHLNALTKDLAKKHDEIDSLTAELQAVKAERDSLRTALSEAAECLACWVGDSPDHEASHRVLSRAKKALNPTDRESRIDGRDS